MLKIAVIVPTLNEEDEIRRTLQAVKAQKPYEVIVADGGSSDGTPTIARSLGDVTLAPPARGRASQIDR